MLDSLKVIIHLIDRNFVVMAVTGLIIQVFKHALELLGLLSLLQLELFVLLFLFLDLLLQRCALLLKLSRLATGHVIANRFLLDHIVLFQIVTLKLQILIDHLSFVDLVQNAIKIHRLFNFCNVLPDFLSELLLLVNSLLQPDEFIALLFQLWIQLRKLIILSGNSASHRLESSSLFVLSSSEILILLHHKLNILQQISNFLTKFCIQVRKRLSNLLSLQIVLVIWLWLPILGHSVSLLNLLVYDQ